MEKSNFGGLFIFFLYPQYQSSCRISCSYLQSLVKDYNNLRSKLSQQSSLKRQKPLTSTKKRPEVLPLVQTMVVVQTLNHNSVSIHWEESSSSLSTAGRTPQCRQVFISSKILCSAKGRSQRQLQTWINLPAVQKTDFALVQDRCHLLQKAVSSV